MGPGCLSSAGSGGLGVSLDLLVKDVLLIFLEPLLVEEVDWFTCEISFHLVLVIMVITYDTRIQDLRLC